MASPTAASEPANASTTATPAWTYPTRFCRICREDVPPTVTMYPPGLPPYLQYPIVEYVNEDEYGRLIKPCMCRGGMRYIHELCLLRSRTENNRAGSMWKCHECGHKFNFQRLAVQRWLSSKYSSGVLTILVMIIIMFSMGFVADPIINLYADPYDTLMGHEPMWNSVKVETPTARGAVWMQHFLKGFVSMGLVGFLKVLVLNPFQWWNLRHTGVVSSRTTSTSGRDRAVNISWIAVIIGVCSAFYFFYHWMQTIVQMTLQRVGNNIVDTQLPGDDDDLKPPPGSDPPTVPKKQEQDPPAATTSEATTTTTADKSNLDARVTGSEFSTGTQQGLRPRTVQQGRKSEEAAQETTPDDPLSGRPLAGSWVVGGNDNSPSSESGSVVHDAISQGWSFADI